jgi:hypothetical protein
MTNLEIMLGILLLIVSLLGLTSVYLNHKDSKNKANHVKW